jgi:hypothetical protein
MKPFRKPLTQTRRVGDIVRVPDGRVAEVFCVFGQRDTGKEQVDVIFPGRRGDASSYLAEDTVLLIPFVEGITADAQG